MNNKYQPIIGLEVHVELSTKSKMFCRCSADYFGKKPNSHTCPVCLGLPGALPYPNEEAIKKCLKIGLALNCQIAEKSLLERKNYFYPDLPKGYQISQYRWPFCINGLIEVKNSYGEKRTIRINRVHQEEDTAKLSHIKGATLIDFNRSGVPLVEIVTEADFHDPEEVRDYAKKLQQIFRYLGVSNADMEKGDMRLEANISVRKVASHIGSGNTELPHYRIELKNINSFRFMVAAINHEIKRQSESLEKGERLVQETRGWDEDKKETFLQRKKEEANDYRYFPEPDLSEFGIKNEESNIKKELPELSDQKVTRYLTDLGLKESQAAILTEDKGLAEYFEKVVELGKLKGVEPLKVANCLVNQKIDLRIDPEKIIEDIISKKVGLVEDEEQIKKWVEEVLAESSQMVEFYKKGKTSVIQALIGAVMKKSSGKANPQKVKELLEKALG